MTIGQRIKEARKNAGMTQKQLADMMGIPFQSVSQWERDLRKPKFETLEKIATVLGVNVTELWMDRYLDHPPTLHFITTVDKLSEYASYSLDKEYQKRRRLLLSSFDDLNSKGQKKAIENVRDLAKIPEYQRETPEDAGEASNTPLEGKDTTQDD